MHRIPSTLVIALLTSVAVAAGAGLPPEVADQLEKAVAFEAVDGFVGSYHLTISTTIQKPNGRSREEELIEAEIMLDENGTELRRLIKYLENGKDVTKKRRKEFEGNRRILLGEVEGKCPKSVPSIVIPGTTIKRQPFYTRL